MSEPTSRSPHSSILISEIQDEDLLQIAEGFCTIFPESWWALYEPPERRPAPAVRHARQAEKLKLLAHHAHVSFIKATLQDAPGKVIGVAGWYQPSFPGCLNQLRPAAFTPAVLARESWSQQHVDEMFAAFNVDALDQSLARGDDVRAETMGDTPHWYLAPLFVLPEYQGRGIGRALSQWAIDQADAHDPPQPMYLQAFGHVRQMYARFGFERLRDRGKRWDNVMVRMARGLSAPPPAAAAAA